ncbi:type II toxin-antitoxin system HicA family toxin [Roseateles saccharophilus]|uniref:HicA-like toxin of HicAB toxin-antitoxin system n=1 Tax=Roseateles saccharophilus TaxID=304 RepID=A0A4R3UM68_ROSSA|nr:type II toxin-antitoxin system HicA family toxin [Roseateles saccharophilus]MDG0833774.1 type II toxin-antitoxin system HicA family toxin [Roseateles saccharophilus]TCU91600.1 HicA-like toxin of HicAB toxin-antitoxin system [Roseateles saccharophilus]
MGKHDKTIEKLLRRPPPADLRWADMAALLVSMGFQEVQGSGSRCRFFHAGSQRVISLHKPHPQPEMDKAAVAQVRDFLIELNFIQ